MRSILQMNRICRRAIKYGEKKKILRKASPFIRLESVNKNNLEFWNSYAMMHAYVYRFNLMRHKSIAGYQSHK